MDLIIGDPYNIPHPIRLIGRYIGWLTTVLCKTDREGEKGLHNLVIKGLILVVTVIVSTAVITFMVIFTAYSLNVYLGVAVEAVLTCYIMATKSLRTESMKVYERLKDDDIEGARYAVSMIVGRDTDCLNREGIIRASVETVAENTSDGVIAPLLFTAIGGPVLGMVYKAVNTMDSMIGYHNDKYEYFGKSAARLDDAVNYLPSRISAIMMIVSSFFGGDFDVTNAGRIFVRDRYNHKSPNSAQTESVCAGALQVRLAGDASYFGKIVSKPYIGDDIRQIEAEDIKRTNRLMYITALLTFMLCSIILGITCFYL